MIKATQLLQELSLFDCEDDLLFQDVNKMSYNIDEKIDDQEETDDEYFNYFQNQIILCKEPKQCFSIENYNIESQSILKDKRTTLMLKNIPIQYTVKDLIAEIDVEFRGKYDFFYMPQDQYKNGNMGYAFINLLMPQFVQEFYKVFNQRKWKLNTHKFCILRYAKIQTH